MQSLNCLFLREPTITTIIINQTKSWLLHAEYLGKCTCYFFFDAGHHILIQVILKKSSKSSLPIVFRGNNTICNRVYNIFSDSRNVKQIKLETIYIEDRTFSEQIHQNINILGIYEIRCLGINQFGHSNRCVWCIFWRCAFHIFLMCFKAALKHS